MNEQRIKIIGKVKRLLLKTDRRREILKWNPGQENGKLGKEKKKRKEEKKRRMERNEKKKEEGEE